MTTTCSFFQCLSLIKLIVIVIVINRYSMFVLFTFVTVCVGDMTVFKLEYNTICLSVITCFAVAVVCCHYDV